MALTVITILLADCYMNDTIKKRSNGHETEKGSGIWRLTGNASAPIGEKEEERSRRSHLFDEAIVNCVLYSNYVSAVYLTRMYNIKVFKLRHIDRLLQKIVHIRWMGNVAIKWNFRNLLHRPTYMGWQWEHIVTWRREIGKEEDKPFYIDIWKELSKVK
jgi:hypothetical protein